MSLAIGGRRLELIATPGGETFDSMVVWLPESRTLLAEAAAAVQQAKAQGGGVVVADSVSPAA